MSTILTVYSMNSFKRYLLPAINDADYSLLLSKGMFHLEDNIELQLEIINHQWYFLSSDAYRLISEQGTSCSGQALNDGNIVKLMIDGKMRLVFIVTETDSYFSIFQKYDIRSMQQPITIGTDVDNLIIFNNLNLVTGKHARIRFNGTEAIFEDLNSANGSFVNNRRVEGGIPLSFGDCIDIYGLRIVYLNTYIAVNKSECNANINERQLHPCTIEEKKCAEVSQKIERKIFHRSPRHIAKIITEEVSIEDAPQPKELNQPSMLMTVAPAMTMSLPMILGCALMVWSNNKSNSGYSSAYQYVGLLTAFSSMLVGVIWAVVAQRNAVKKFEQDKAYRSRKYRDYVNKKERLIREAYDHNTHAMYERYLPADACCAFDATNSALWNRNVMQNDFLFHRVGIGDVPFQGQIRIPAERFSLIEDELMELPAKIKKNYAMLRNVPVCVDLLKEKLIGIIGGKNMEGAVNVAQALIAQIAANNSYTDVKLVIIYDEKRNSFDGAWNFARWLPHVWNETGTFRYVASNKEEASEVFFELAKKIRYRIENAGVRSSQNDNVVAEKPYYVVIMANPDALDGELISKYLFDSNPVYGVSTLYLSENYEDLPNECEFILQNDGHFHGMYYVTDDADERIAINFDAIAPVLLEQLATNLADIEVREIETGGDVPNSLTFFEMYGIHKLQELNVLERWRKNRTYETMKALIGERSGGALCYLDVHEKYHGPHGLVAGTTGSGKSETLQTYILSLCVNFSPKDVALFIIDYKGGGMGNLFTNLPHMIGQISNLSGNQIYRALVSIKSEKDRRQRIFNEYSVNNINSYTKLYKNNETKIPVPHLFIIIDEFAEMKRDEPDFIQELVSVSQVGRSLGIHLIMATQKPAGTVDDNIWSNSKFKLCLRVQDRQDSMDMLHRADAAYITQAGRCYLQVGNDELFELFQSGWSGAVYSEDEADRQIEVAKMLAIDGIPALEGSRTKIAHKHEQKCAWIESILAVLRGLLDERGAELSKICETMEGKNSLVNELFVRLKKQKIEFPLSESNVNALNALIDLCITEGTDAEAVIFAADKQSKRLPQHPEKTQLDAVVAYLKETAEENQFLYDFQLFLPLLPTKLILAELPHTTLPFNEDTTFNGLCWPEHNGRGSLAVSMGLFDDPENQRQDTFVLDIMKANNIAIIGAAATGKSTFLQTFLFGMLSRYTPDEVNVYVVDFSAKMLAVFEGAPHVGDVMYEDDIEKIAKFFAYASRILEKRKEMLKGGNFEQYVSINGQGSLPAVVIAIDNYSGFQLKGGLTEDNLDFLLQLSKEGASYGIFLIVTAAGFGHEELPNRMAENFRTTISLELNDYLAYTEVLRRTVRQYPETDIKGRGIAIIEDRILEFQTALGLEAGSDYERGELIKDKMKKMSAAWNGKFAKPIPSIPEKPLWNQFESLEEVKEMSRTERFLPLGYEAHYADIFGIDLSKFFTYLISGVKRKGKTNALKALILSAGAKSGQVVVIDYSSSLTKICEMASAIQITTEEQFYQYLVDFLPKFEERNIYKHKLIDEGMEEDEIFDKMQRFERIYFFVDDLPGFVEKTYSLKEDSKIVGDYHGLMEQMIDLGAMHNFFWFVSVNKREPGLASTYQLYHLFLRDKKGIHLGGNTSDSPMNFDHIPYRIRDQVMPAGRGLLPADNEDPCTEVVIPLVKVKGGIAQD